MLSCVLGLNLILYKQHREYLSGFTERSGFRIVLNEFKTMTFPVEAGFSVQPGVEANIGFKLVRYRHPSHMYMHPKHRHARTTHAHVPIYKYIFKKNQI